MLNELMKAAILAAHHSSAPPVRRQDIRISLTAGGLVVEGTYRTDVGRYDHEHLVSWKELDANPRFAEIGVRCTIREMDARAFQHGDDPVRPPLEAVES